MSSFFRVRDHDDGEVKTSASYPLTHPHTHLYPVSTPGRGLHLQNHHSLALIHLPVCALRQHQAIVNQIMCLERPTLARNEVWIVLYEFLGLLSRMDEVCAVIFTFYISLANNMQQLNSAYKSVGQLVSEQDYYTTGGISVFVSHSRGVSGAFNCL